MPRLGAFWQDGAQKPRTVDRRRITPVSRRIGRVALNRTTGGRSMSYGFLMMRPKVDGVSIEDLSEEALVMQDPGTVTNALSALFPAIAWRREGDGAWFGALNGEDGWYEFRIGPKPDFAWSIDVSRRAAKACLVSRICTKLGVIAFDRQSSVILQRDAAALIEDSDIPTSPQRASGSS